MSEKDLRISRFLAVRGLEADKACPQALRVETALVVAGGKMVPVQLALSVVHEIEKAHVCIVVSDLTDQKRIETLLRSSRDELELKVRQRTAELETSKEELEARNEELQTIQDQLQVRNEELQTTGEELQAQNEELRVTKDELEESAQALEEANKELEAFSYSVSHDLRAPLRHISGFAKIVSEDYADRLDTTGKDYLGRIMAGSEKMLCLISDLLQFSRLARLEIKRGMVDMSKLASDIIQQLSAADPGRKIEFDLKGGLIGFVDANLIEIALANLLGNAWKFTSKTENCRIEFGGLKQNDRAVYYVKDNGAGFNPEYKNKLFHPFQRLHSDNEFEGMGIGLAMVERIIRRHGGKVWAESETGKGATFFFTLN
jgi:signal transduction histidine kinase